MRRKNTFLPHLAFALAFSTFLLAGCAKNPSPEKVVENYFVAQSEGNTFEAKKSMSPDSVDFMEFTEKAMGYDGMKVVNEGNRRLFAGASFSYGKAVCYEKDAIVKVTVRKGGATLDFNMRVRLYDGKWLLPLFSISNNNPEMVKLLSFLQVQNELKIPVSADVQKIDEAKQN